MRKKVIRILFIAALALTAISVLLPGHIRRALVYGHVNIDDYRIFDNRKVSAGIPSPWLQDAKYNTQPPDTASLRQFDAYQTVAFLVVQHNRLLHEAYWDGYGDTSHSNSFSVAKSIISLLIGCLRDEGKIKSLDEPISNYLPGFSNTGTYRPTIRNLLTMSSGIGWDEEYSSLFAPTTRAYYGTDLSAQMMELKVTTEPGRIFDYQSCNSQLLGMIIRRASGQTISEYASEKLWKPLGAETAAFWCTDAKNGIEKSYCCFNSSARDFARIGQLVLDSGRFNKRQVVSEAYLREALAPAGYLRDKDNSPCNFYGYHFWRLNYKGHEVVYARGILGQYIFVIPSLDAVVVRLGKSRSTEYRDHAPVDVFVYLDEAYRMMGIQ